MRGNQYKYLRPSSLEMGLRSNYIAYIFVFCQVLGNVSCLLSPLSLGSALRASNWSKKVCGYFHPVTSVSIPGLREAPCLSPPVPHHQLLGRDWYSMPDRPFTWHRPLKALVRLPKPCLKFREEYQGTATVSGTKLESWTCQPVT